MKRALHLMFFMALFIASNTLFAQAPSKFNYQAVARNAVGNALANQNISVRFTIHHLTDSGTTLYQETHSITTNAQGLFTARIGDGNAVGGGSIDNISWNDGDMYLQVELDAAGGTAYTEMGTAQLISVPYAKHADDANTVTLYPPAGGFSNKPIVTHSLARPNTGILYRGFSDEVVFQSDAWPQVTVNLKDSITTVDGKLKITGSTPGFGKQLVSDGNGFATWQKVGPAYATGVNGGTVTVNSTGVDLNIGTVTYTKLQSNTELVVEVNSRAASGTFTGGATNIRYQIKVDGVESINQNMYFIFSSNTTEFINLKSVFTNLSAGVHTITVFAKTNAGTSTNVGLDSGGYGGRLFIKEMW